MNLSYPDNRTHIAIALLIIFDFFWFSFSAERVYPSFVDTKLQYAVFAWILTGLGIGAGRPITHGEALAYGALLGVIVYGVFNATEATIRPDWRQAHIIIADILWGTLLCMIVSVICFASVKSEAEIKWSIIGVSIVVYVVAILYICLVRRKSKTVIGLQTKPPSTFQKPQNKITRMKGGPIRDGPR